MSVVLSQQDPIDFKESVNNLFLKNNRSENFREFSGIFGQYAFSV